jgi:hypothetical protein
MTVLNDVNLVATKSAEPLTQPSSRSLGQICFKNHRAYLISYESLLNQTVEYVSDLLRALLRVSLLAAFIVHKCDTEACLIPFRPFEVTAQKR